jgi:transposase-like protein
MTRPIVRDPIYRRRRFDAEIIELCVRWYITYRLSYRDLVAMMAERGIAVSHTTIHRWVIRYMPEFDKRWNRFVRPVNNSWRVDETYIRVGGKWNYLYRAVDKHGKTVDFLLRPDRSVAAAQAFFRKALSRCLPKWPRKITLDGLKQSHLALRYLRREDPKWKYVQVRCSQYLNNLIEQDHRAIKRRCASMAGFKSFRCAAITLAGIELAHRIRRGNSRSGAAGIGTSDRSSRSGNEHSPSTLPNGKSQMACPALTRSGAPILSACNASSLRRGLRIMRERE